MPPTDDEEIAERLAAELRLLRGPLEGLTGLTSRWNGIVQVEPFLDDALARFRPTGVVAVEPRLWRMKVRWRTLLHELIHSIAVPVGAEYNSHMGSEEGPVEALQRALLPEIMRRAGQAYSADLVREWEALWLYNEYVEAVEEIRAALGSPEPMAFYGTLLSVPVGGRIAHLTERALRQGGRVTLLRIAGPSARLRVPKLLGSVPREQALRIRRLEAEVEDDA